jgi:sulfite reductase alpha subunit-like flavoprotein
MSLLCSASTVLMPTESNVPTTQQPSRPPLTRSTRRLSISFRKIKQALGTITHVDIFTGSLTGTSERFAASLAEKATQRGALASLKTLEEFDPECFYDPNGPYHSTLRVIVFVVSTHFAGGPSPNAEAFSQWLRLVSGDSGASVIDPPHDEEPVDTATSGAPVVQPSPPTSPALSPTTENTHVSTSGGLRRLTQLSAARPAPSPRRQSSFSAAIRPLLRMNWRNAFGTASGSAGPSKAKNPLHGVQYAVFGVGNSMYLTYNAMGKFVDARLQAVGAVRLCPLGLGDVSNDIDDAFAKWEAQLLQLFVNQKPGPPVGIAAEAREASFERRRMSSDAQVKADPAIVPLTPIAPSPPGSKTSSKTPEDVTGLPRQPSASGSSSSSVASSGSASKFCVRDHYGRHVRLRFRCKFVTTVLKEDRGLSSLKLPPIGAPTEKTRVNYLTRRSSSLRRHATHIRHPCIALQSIAMLKQASTSADDQASASALKEVSLARLVILDPELVFETADTFGYFPPNSKDIVEVIGSRLGLDMDAYVELSFHDDAPTTSAAGQTTEAEESTNKDRHLLFPSPCKIRTILSDFLELRAISREFVRVASGFVADQKEHELLENLASIDGSASFVREFAQASSGLLKLLELAPSLRMPFEVFVNITPLLKPRLYSIASSHLKNDREFEVVVALGNPSAAHGLAVSNFRRILSKSDVTLAGDSRPSNSVTTQNEPASPLSSGVRLLRGFITTSRFKTPADLSAPMVLIANGIGVAPLRALLQHRELESGKHAGIVASPQLSNGKSNAVTESLEPRSSIGKNLLLLGCANKASVLFASELRSWESNGFLELHIIYSAEPEHPAQYVQDLVATQKQIIAAVMSSSPEARIYVCGKVAMARAVNQVLAVVDTSDGGTSWYQKALQSGRYIEGIFG